MHLTNFSLNKNSEHYQVPEDNFLENDNGSKRLLSTVYEQLATRGHDIEKIKVSICDTVRKSIIAMEPYLEQSFKTRINPQLDQTRPFQILGVDILLDRKLRAWLMEVNSNPSLNIFLEKDDEEAVKQLSELDKYVKTKVVTEAVRLVSGQGSDQFRDVFTKVRGDDDRAFSLWSQAQ